MSEVHDLLENRPTDQRGAIPYKVLDVYQAAMALFEKWEIGRIYIDHQNTDSEKEADELDLLVERFDVACRRAKGEVE